MFKFFRCLRHSASPPQVLAASTSRPFLSCSSSLTLALFSPPSFISIFLSDLAESAFSILYYQATMGLWTVRHPFIAGNDAADELARREVLLLPSAIPCSLCPLISRIHFCLFSDWRCIVSSKFFDPQVSSISTEELVLPRHARCVLSRLRCNGRSLLLGSYLSRIGRIENLSCSACGHSSQDTSHLILHCPAADSATLCLSTTSGPGSGELPGFWGSMIFRHAPIPRNGSGNNKVLEFSATNKMLPCV